MVIANVSAFLVFLKPLLNSVKLALLLILWSFLSVLIEVHPLAWAGGRRRRQRYTGVVMRAHTLVLIISSLAHRSLFSYRHG